MRTSKPLEEQNIGKVVCWFKDDRIHFYSSMANKKPNLFLDGHSHVRFDLAERFHQEL